jgi:L-threonylcarbamoyladenylate synthase
MEVISEKELDIAVRFLKEGKIIAFPTETVYGIGADGRNRDAYYRLYRVKEREEKKPFQFLIRDTSDMEKMADQIPRKAYRLAEKFWPGGLTIILWANRDFSWQGAKIGLRCPDHNVPQRLMCAINGPLVASSANISGERELVADEIRYIFYDRIDLLIYGEEKPKGIPSTVVDLTKGMEMIREGVIPLSEIEECIE